MSTKEGARLIKTRNPELPILWFVSCNRQLSTQRGWKAIPEHKVAKGQAQNSLPVSAKKYRTTQTSPPLLQNLSAWGWIMPPCSSCVETANVKRSPHRTQWIGFTIALLLKHPLPQTPWWRGQQAPISHQLPWPILRVSLEVPNSSQDFPLLFFQAQNNVPAMTS